MFIFKKIVSQFFFPLPLIFLLILFGLYLLWFTKKQKLGKIFVSIAAFVLLILSYSVVPDALLFPLEREYKAYPDENSLKESEQRVIKKSIDYVVVLGAGHASDINLPLTGKIGKESLFRLTEGIRIHRENTGSKLILSGGAVYDSVANATIVAELAVKLGVDKSNVITETKPKDTKDEAILINKIVGNNSFVLVTSASHMPRAIALFRKLGMNPIPAPTEHNIKETQGISPGLFFPNAANIRNAEKAIYEYMGIVWAKLRGQI